MKQGKKSNRRKQTPFIHACGIPFGKIFQRMDDHVEQILQLCIPIRLRPTGSIYIYPYYFRLVVSISPLLRLTGSIYIYPY